MPCQRMQKRLIDGVCTEILQRQRLKSSNCTKEATARDLYLVKQQMRLPRSGRLELIEEQLCREGLGVLVGSKPNMSKWLREGPGLVQPGQREGSRGSGERESQQQPSHACRGIIKKMKPGSLLCYVMGSQETMGIK